MAELTMAAVAAHFGRDLGRTLAKLEGILHQARRRGVDLLVLPDATLGGYLTDLRHPAVEVDNLPLAVDLGGPEITRVIELAGDMTVCIGFTEKAAGLAPLTVGVAAQRPGLAPQSPEPNPQYRHNSAVCVSGDGILGLHRKVHLPLGESEIYRPGEEFRAFDTPVGRLGLLIDFDKTFPESARTLALDGAEILACLNAWPASVTDRSDRIRNDRQSHLFDLYDCARAAENQVYLVSSNQTGVYGGLRFLGQAKVVDPAGEIIARTGAKGGLAVAEADVTAAISRARRSLDHIHQRAEHAYRLDGPALRT